MQVKKYIAKTIGDATARVKNDLGPDAMILSTKRLDGTGGHLFEISAVPSGASGVSNDSDTLSAVKSELVSIKEMICLLNHTGHMDERWAMNPEVLNLYAKLIRRGIDDTYVRFFLEKGGALKVPSGSNGNHIGAKTVREMMKILKVKNPFETGDSHRIIAAFVGTTGVGKTTTIAKLAAQLMLKERKKVGLISVDGYRIGAFEQLKTYANILGVSCMPAFNKKDLLFALNRLEGKEVVLIDTAGQSQYDQSRMEELRKMMTDDLEINCHLLLSMSTSAAEMNRTAINFSPLKYQSYIFTKIDETERYGSLINQIMKLNRPVSFITNGQNVPEDIEKADKERIIQLLFNKKTVHSE